VCAGVERAHYGVIDRRGVLAEVSHLEGETIGPQLCEPFPDGGGCVGSLQWELTDAEALMNALCRIPCRPQSLG
jgi:hypothetical protein